MTWCKLIKKPLHKMIWGGILAAFAFIISGIVELNLLVSPIIELKFKKNIRFYNL